MIRARLSTSPAYWDEYWQQRALPSEIRKGQSLYLDELIKVFETHLPRGESRTALEIGGAPGRLPRVHASRPGLRHHRARLLGAWLPDGEEKLRAPGHSSVVSYGDMFEARQPPAALRSRFSLGLIRHFSEPEHVIEAHLRYLKPGGTLMIGCPNFLGVNRAIVKRLAPSCSTLSILESRASRGGRHSTRRSGSRVRSLATSEASNRLSPAAAKVVALEPARSGSGWPSWPRTCTTSEPSPSQPQRELVE